jgi:branched-chain amino acid transport system permease protein
LQLLAFGLMLGGVYGLLALGYSLVYGVLEFINFAHGDVFMVGAFVAWITLNAVTSHTAFPPVAIFIIMLLSAMAACAVLGVTIERIAYRPLRRAPRLAPLISAIGVSLVLQNAVLLLQLWALGDVRIRHVKAAQVIPTYLFNIGPVRITLTALVVLVVALGLMLCLDVVVSHTRLGRSMRATAQDPEVAGLMGIDPNRVVMLTFLIGSALAGSAGMLLALYYTQIDHFMGYGAGIKAFTAAVLGGIGNVRGAMLGGLALGVTESMSVAFFDPAYKDLVAFVVLIAVLVLRPGGLLGSYLRERV